MFERMGIDLLEMDRRIQLKTMEHVRNYRAYSSVNAKAQSTLYIYTYTQEEYANDERTRPNRDCDMTEYMAHIHCDLFGWIKRKLKK